MDTFFVKIFLMGLFCLILFLTCSWKKAVLLSVGIVAVAAVIGEYSFSYGVFASASYICAHIGQCKRRKEVVFLFNALVLNSLVLFVYYYSSWCFKGFLYCAILSLFHQGLILVSVMGLLWVWDFCKEYDVASDLKLVQTEDNSKLGFFFVIGVAFFLSLPICIFLNFVADIVEGDYFYLFCVLFIFTIIFLLASACNIKDEKRREVRLKNKLLVVAGMAAVMMRYNGGYTDGARDLFRGFLAERYSGAEFYEERFAEDAEKRLELLIGKRKLSFKKFCIEVNRSLSYEEKVNLTRLLFDIAILDGSIYPEERNILSNIMVHIRIGEKQAQAYDSMYSRYYYDSRSSRESAKGTYTSSGTYMPSRVVEAYAQLGLKVGTAFDEVKRVYRRLVFENHPDRLAHADEASRAAANTRIRELNSAMRVIEDFAAKG